MAVGTPTIANNLDSNISEVVLDIFAEEFEKNRVATKTVQTGLLTGANKFETAKFGDTLFTKRPHQYRIIRTPGGSLADDEFNDIISGRIAFNVQEYITVAIPWSNREETLELNALDKIIRPAAQYAVVEYETSFQNFMIQNSGLSFWVVGNALSKWGDVANFRALMNSIGVPESGRHYTLTNPFQIRNLADTQTGLASGSNNLVDTAWKKSMISENFGGMSVLTSNSMSNYVTGVSADRLGSIASFTTPQTYESVKDTMQQIVVIDDLTDNDIFVPGDVIEVTGTDGPFRTNVKTRQIAFDQNGNAIPWRWTLLPNPDTGDAAFPGYTVASNQITATVTNASIFEFTSGVTGQYDNISRAIVANDVCTFLGASATAYQPNLFYHEEAFAVDTVALPKLHTWDSLATTEDGINMRVTKWSDGQLNEQYIRFDMLPAFSVLNPLFAGTGWGE